MPSHELLVADAPGRPHLGHPRPALGHGSVDVADLAERFGVSQATLRRDLQILEEQRLLRRTHGGALAQDVLYELPVRYRHAQHREQKRRIAAEVVTRIPEGPVAVGLTGGTTTSEVARLLVERTDLTVVTNALNIAAELALRPRLKLVVTGGVARSQSYELVGPWAEHTLRGVNVGLAVIGVDGISADGGLTTHDEVEAHTNATLIERAATERSWWPTGRRSAACCSRASPGSTRSTSWSPTTRSTPRRCRLCARQASPSRSSELPRRLARVRTRSVRCPGRHGEPYRWPLRGRPGRTPEMHLEAGQP